MKRVRKLTPATLKRIIAEEKFKLRVLEAKKRKMVNRKIVESYLKALKLLDATKEKTTKKYQLKKIEESKKIIKEKLLKRL